MSSTVLVFAYCADKWKFDKDLLRQGFAGGRIMAERLRKILSELGSLAPGMKQTALSLFSVQLFLDIVSSPWSWLLDAEISISRTQYRSCELCVVVNDACIPALIV